MDDDIMGVKFWNPITRKFFENDTKLQEVFLECFTLMDKDNLGSFTFPYHESSPNGLTTATLPRLSFKNNFLYGAIFGCRNEPELINTTYGHEDDGMRTIHFFNKYGGCLKFNHASFKNPGTGISPGGLQSSGDRELGKDTAEKIFNDPVYRPYIHSIKWNEKCQMHSLKFHNKIAMKKVLESKNIPVRFRDYDTA
jgi:hypothetical protein